MECVNFFTIKSLKKTRDEEEKNITKYKITLIFFSGIYYLNASCALNYS